MSASVVEEICGSTLNAETISFWKISFLSSFQYLHKIKPVFKKANLSNQAFISPARGALFFLRWLDYKFVVSREISYILEAVLTNPILNYFFHSNSEIYAESCLVESFFEEKSSASQSIRDKSYPNIQVASKLLRHSGKIVTIFKIDNGGQDELKNLTILSELR